MLGETALATTRVYILAKELGVKSPAVVKKCQDEGLDIKNHMSVISAGLAATIHEWFSEGENAAAVDTAEEADMGRATQGQKDQSPAGMEKLVPDKSWRSFAEHSRVSELVQLIETANDYIERTGTEDSSEEILIIYESAKKAMVQLGELCDILKKNPRLALPPESAITKC